MKNIIPIIILSLFLFGCKAADEESTTTSTTTTSTSTYTCTGSSSGSGPTIGGVTLEEATYKSGTKSFAFVNSTSANVGLSGGTPLCYTIAVSSLTASMLKTNSANTGNATIG